MPTQKKIIYYYYYLCRWPHQEQEQNRMTTEQAKETEEVQGNKSINFSWMCFIF